MKKGIFLYLIFLFFMLAYSSPAHCCYSASVFRYHKKDSISQRSLLRLWPAGCVGSKRKRKGTSTILLPTASRNPKPKPAHLPLWKQTSGFQEYCGRFHDTSTLSSSRSLNQLLHRLLAVWYCNVFHYGMCTQKTTNPKEAKDNSHFIRTQESIYKEATLRYYN